MNAYYKLMASSFQKKTMKQGHNNPLKMQPKRKNIIIYKTQIKKKTCAFVRIL